MGHLNPTKLMGSSVPKQLVQGDGMRSEQISRGSLCYSEHCNSFALPESAPLRNGPCCLQKQVVVSEGRLVSNLTRCLYERGPEGQGNREVANSHIHENTDPEGLGSLHPVSCVIFTCELQVFIRCRACSAWFALQL